MDLVGVAARLLRLLFGEQLLVVVDARLALGVAGARRELYPLELVLQRPAAGGGLLLLLGEPRVLLRQPGGVVALPRDAGAAVELEDPAGDVVEEVAVVGNRDDGPLVLGQVALQPGDRLGVEVVRGLVQQQHVGLAQENLAERHAAAFAAGEPGDVGIRRRQPEGVHGDLELPVELPEVLVVDAILQARELVGGLVRVVHRQLFVARQYRLLLRDRILDMLEHGLRGIERRLLLQESDRVALRQERLAVVVLVEAGHDPQQRRLAGAVVTEDTDLGAVVEGQPDSLQDLLALGCRLAQLLHRINDLRHAREASRFAAPVYREGCRDAAFNLVETRLSFPAYRAVAVTELAVALAAGQGAG